MKTRKSFGEKLLGTVIITAILGLGVLPSYAGAVEEKATFKSKSGEVIAEFTASDFLGVKEEAITFMSWDDGGNLVPRTEVIKINYYRNGSTFHVDLNQNAVSPSDEWILEDYTYGAVSGKENTFEELGNDFLAVVGDAGATYTFGRKELAYLELVNISSQEYEGTYYWFQSVDELPAGATPAKGEKPGAPEKQPDTQGNMVKSHDANMLVNGKASAFEAYEIQNNNYFKLRDLAKVLSGTEKQFDVSWDSAKNAIELVSGKAYTEVGGELAKADGSSKQAVQNTSKIYLDGKELALTAYTIGGNNYFKLRDLGKAVNFAVGWDNASSTITVDTTKAYTE